MPLHSGDVEEDKIEVPFVQSVNSLTEEKNPFKAKVDPQTTVNVPCLVPFVIW